MNKYCRICWNTSGWRYPTGNAGETPGTYVAEHGFGHEEWLFNYQWLLQGYRYGFLQPIGKFRNKYVGDNFTVLLYTITPEKDSLLVGQINNLYVPTDAQLSSAFHHMARNGWINQMVDDVKRVKGVTSSLTHPDPTDIANVCFRPQDVLLYDPMKRVLGKHKILRNKRYQPFDWEDGEFPHIYDQLPGNDPRRLENERTRGAQEGTTYNPRHVKLQNRLYDFLVNKYGQRNVFYERNFVDLKVIIDNQTTFYEIKMENSAKKCIRNAIGQLLEYIHYPNTSRANKLIVVGDAPPNNDDINYLTFLRGIYKLPIFYALFNWETGMIDREI